MFVVPTSAGVLVLVFVILHGDSVLSQEYCDIEACDPGQQTLCRFPNSGPGPNCQGYEPAPLTSEEMAAIVQKHNDLRQKVAQGQEQRGNPGPQPSASNMKQLEWDDELAVVAQRWADQCAGAHDTCRNVPRFSSGQNIFMQWGSSSSMLNGPIEDTIDSWQDEAPQFNPDLIEPFVFDPSYGHYTQLNWAETKYVGCARVLYEKDGWYYRTLTCNYGPAGNYRGASLYKIGAPGSACPDGPGTIAGLCN